MRRLGRALASAFVTLRLPILIAWIAAVAWVVVSVAPLHGNPGGTLHSLLPAGSPAVRAERISTDRFEFPLLSRTIVVVRNPRGLPAARQASLVALARRLSLRRVAGFSQIAGALPLPDAIGRPPFARHPGTTMLLYLFFRPSVSAATAAALARRLVADQVGHRPGEYEGVTGEAPATVAQDQLINGRLLWVALATLLVVAVAVGARFRALPVAGLTVVAIISAYLVADRVVAELARASGATVPSQVQPVMIVLVFGVASDYAVFFISRFRALLRAGSDRRQAAVRTVREITPIVFAAGVTVAAATAALLVANPAFIRGFGPALAIAVLLAMAVAITFVPAALALGGRWLFWPGFEPPEQAQRTPSAVSRRLGGGRFASARVAARHPLIAVVISLAVVAAAASGLRHIRVANEMVLDLPANAEAHRAYDVARAGFAPGALAPTLVVVTGAGVGSQATALGRLERELAQQPGVVKVLGPSQSPSQLGIAAPVWRTSDAARYALVLGQDPFGSQAIAQVRALQGSLPRLLRSSGLAGAHGLVGGDTAISAGIVDATIGDLELVIPLMLVAIFGVIAIYLRALVAPLYLVATSVLAAAAALGLAVYVVQDSLGYGQTAYYAVLTVAVMLIAIGSDYNVFLIGRIWQQSRRGSLDETVAAAGSRAARSIATAAVVLVLSFVLLAIVPLRPFREIAFAMAAGLLIDAFVVRAILVPALLVLVGERSAWPGHMLGAGAPALPDLEVAAD